MSERISEKPSDWAPIIKRALWQVAYRNLGMISLHVPIDVVANAIDILTKEGMGNWKWLLEGRVLVWENIPIDHALKIHAYVLGSKHRRENIAIIRQGFWRMWFIEAGLRIFDKTIVGRILARL